MAVPQSYAAPLNLIDVQDIDSNLSVDLAYRGRKNFLGRKVQSYQANTCYLKDSAARALSAANNRLKSQNPPLQLSLRDCWRPYSATQDMQNWAIAQDNKNTPVQDLSETQKTIFQDSRLFQIIGNVAVLKTRKLFNFGYLSGGYSQHNRGSTVDIELKIHNGSSWILADTGTRFDTFSNLSRFNAPVSAEARRNRSALANAMRSEGFRVLGTEWWHWTHSSNGGEFLDGVVD